MLTLLVAVIALTAVKADYSCYHYSLPEQNLIKSKAYPEKQICEHDQSRTFTGGANADYRGCGSCYCCKADYSCHHYSPLELELIKSKAYSEKQICEHIQSRKFTGGSNADYRGCGSCYCCKADYSCYHYSPLELELIRSKAYSEKQICEHIQSRKFTGGSNADYRGCGSCYCCKESPNGDTFTYYSCYHYSPLELELIKSKAYSEKQICEHDQSRTFTGGANADYRGCGSCYCCKAKAALEYDCYNYNATERAQMATMSENDVCEQDPLRTFTRGNNKDYPGCGICWCCKSMVHICRNCNSIQLESWKCYHYSDIERNAMRTRTEKEVCEHTDGRVFTKGRNAAYPGCGSCWCCTTE